MKLRLKVNQHPIAPSSPSPSPQLHLRWPQTAPGTREQLHCQSHTPYTTYRSTMPPISTPTMSLLSSAARPSCPSCRLTTQIRHASLLRRPKRPYTFTQMITLSDGSTYLHRTTSPVPIYRSTKDTKNNPLWNPSSQKLANVEEDEAGRLKRFRGRFGRGWDAEVVTGVEEVSCIPELRLTSTSKWNLALTFISLGKRRRGKSCARARSGESARPHFWVRTRGREEGRGSGHNRAEAEERKG